MCKCGRSAETTHACDTPPGVTTIIEPMHTSAPPYPPAPCASCVTLRARIADLERQQVVLVRERDVAREDATAHSARAASLAEIATAETTMRKAAEAREKRLREAVAYYTTAKRVVNWVYEEYEDDGMVARAALDANLAAACDDKPVSARIAVDLGLIRSVSHNLLRSLVAPRMCASSHLRREGGVGEGPKPLPFPNARHYDAC